MCCCSARWFTSFISNREDEGEQNCSESGRRHCSLPPVSPYRCRRQAVLDLLFDDVWQELVGCMKGLVQRHWECCSSSRTELISSSFITVKFKMFILILYIVIFVCDWQLMKKIRGTWAPFSRTTQIPSCCSPWCLQCYPRLAKPGCPRSQLACSSRSVYGLSLSLSSLSAVQEVSSKLRLCCVKTNTSDLYTPDNNSSASHKTFMIP